jgi:hypothetical protein
MNTMIVNTQGGKSKISNRKEKEKIHVSAEEWRTIMSAINHGMGIPMDSRREVLMGYQYTLHQHKKKLLEEKSELRISQENNITSTRSRWEEYSEASESSKERHQELKHSRRRTEWPGEEDQAESIDTFLDEEEDFIQDTAEAALVAAQAYLLTTQPEPGDPRSSSHKKSQVSWGRV